MKKLFHILFIIFISACSSNNEESEDYTIKPEEEKLRSILKNKIQCDLIGDYKVTEVSDLDGIWNDTLIWKTQKNDSCYYGFEELDRHISLKLNSSKSYVWEETFTVPSRNFVEYGEYFLFNENNITELLLSENGKKDSISNHGDTLQYIKYRLFWVDSMRMFLLPPSPSNTDYKHYEVIEFNKTTR